MANTIAMAPGVYVFESDISQYIQTLSSTLMAEVITATRGPVNVNVQLTSSGALVNQFGVPDENHPGLIVGRNFLQAGGSILNVVRITDGTDTAATASLSLITGGSPFVLTAAETGSFFGSTDGNSFMSAVVSNGQQSPTSYSHSTTLTASTVSTLTLPNVPLAPGTVQVLEDSTVQATDDGAGNLVFPTGADLADSTGTVNYLTGVVSITPPSDYTTATKTLKVTANYFSTFNLQLKYQVLNAGSTVSTTVLEAYTGLTLANFVSSLANSANLAAPEAAPAAFPVAGTYAFSGGTDGTDSLSDADFIGNTLGANPTGLQLFANADEIDLNLVAIPGRSSSAITEALINLCSVSRLDCICLLDPPVDTIVQTVEDWANAAGDYSDNEVIDTTYAAIYFPWYSSNNGITGGVDLAPPSAAAVQAFAQSNYWQAPAGPNRGLLQDYAGISVTLDAGDRASLGSNRINPISNLAGLGVMILGQYTATLEASSLDRVGARMTLLQIEKSVTTGMYSFLFEQNNQQTWTKVGNLIQPYLTSLVSANRIYAGVIYCDSTTNTQDNINNNIMSAVIVLQLPKYAEVIALTFLMTEEGVTIQESILSNVNNAITN